MVQVVMAVVVPGTTCCCSEAATETSDVMMKKGREETRGKKGRELRQEEQGRKKVAAGVAFNGAVGKRFPRRTVRAFSEYADGDYLYEGGEEMGRKRLVAPSENRKRTGWGMLCSIGRYTG